MRGTEKITWEDTSHWFLRHHMMGHVIDPTSSQFKTTPNYELGRHRAFLTTEPSLRARELIRRCWNARWKREEK
jgi:hypothetical protein